MPEDPLIYVPYAYIWPPVWRALEPYDPIGVEMTTEASYLEFFIERWASGEPFIVIEHDVIVKPGQIEGLRACRHPWCCYPELNGSESFSVVRFSRRFIANHPNVWTDLKNYRPEGWRKLPLWCYLDCHLVREAEHLCHLHRDIPTVNARPFGPLH